MTTVSVFVPLTAGLPLSRTITGMWYDTTTGGRTNGTTTVGTTDMGTIITLECGAVISGAMSSPRYDHRGYGGQLYDNYRDVVRGLVMRYGDSVNNTADENSSIFSLVRMRWLSSARACGQ